MPAPSHRPFLSGPARCEFLFTAPFSLLGGGLYGLQIGPGGGLGLAASVVACALGLTAFVAFQIALEPWVVARFGGREGRWGLAVAYLWDAVTGTVVGLPLVAVLGTPDLPGIGAAVSAGAVYGFLMGNVVCGDGPAVAARALLGQGGIKRGSDHSAAQALEARGRREEALAVYAEAVSAHPLDPLPYLASARILEGLGRREEALAMLRRGKDRARLDEQQQVLVLQRMSDLCHDLGCRRRMAPELARYLESVPDGPGVVWARGELEEIKRLLAEGMRLDSDPGGRTEA